MLCYEKKSKILKYSFKSVSRAPLLLMQIAGVSSFASQGEAFCLMPKDSSYVPIDGILSLNTALLSNASLL